MMSDDAIATLRAFLRRWSTIDLTPASRVALYEDCYNVRALLEVEGASTDIIIKAMSARNRAWFAEQLLLLDDTQH